MCPLQFGGAKGVKFWVTPVVANEERSWENQQGDFRIEVWYIGCSYTPRFLWENECINVLGGLGVSHTYAMWKRHVSQGWVMRSKTQSKDTVTFTSGPQQMRTSS